VNLVDAGIAASQVQLTVPMGRAADEPELVLAPYQRIEVMPCWRASSGCRARSR
jgi:hypothetical protein